jgi:hypothetical protein
VTWPAPVETASQLRATGSVTLDQNGNGVINFDPDNARQRWEVTSVVVSTNQPATATVVPVATTALNTTDITQLSQGNNRGQSWSGNQDTFGGQADVGPCDYFAVAFSPPPGTPAATNTDTGQATGPSAFQQLAVITLPAPGVWVIDWTVVLGGTPGSADTNNFRLVAGGTVPVAFLTESVNADTVGSYPQTPYTYTAAVAGVEIMLTTGPTNASAAAVYTGTVSTPSGSPLAGVIAYAIVTGTKFTRRA